MALFRDTMLSGEFIHLFLWVRQYNQECLPRALGAGAAMSICCALDSQLPTSMLIITA